MKILIPVFIYCLFLPSLWSQNIVPNPSFEISKKKPRYMSSTGRDFEAAVYRWTVPNEASTDLLSPRFDSKNLKFTEARTGKQMIGIVINGDYWAEYAKIKLKEPLVPGQEYYTEYWISMPNYYSKKKPVSTPLNDHFGLYFSKDIYHSDKRILVATPASGASTQDVAHPNKWHKVSGKFIAKEAATHLYLGQFQDKKNPSKISEGYFLIDDVFVEAFSSSAVDYTPSRYYSIKGNTASVSIENIYFETDKYELLPSSYTELENLVTILNKNPGIDIEIQGHTDDVGSEAHNEELSFNRAKTVYNYLESSGIPASRLSYKGYGISKPIESNASEEGRQRNRRVDFIVEKSPELEDSREMMAPEFIYKFSNSLPKNKYSRHSFIGRYLQKWHCPSGSQEEADVVEYNQLKNSVPKNASSYIIQKIKNEKAVFFKEYPEHPQNRVFVSELLQDLFQAGFTYLAIEDVNPNDTQLNNRAYPVINTGYYVKDPVFGDLIRQAYDVGFEIISYNPTDVQVKKALNIVKKKTSISDPVLLKQCAKDWSRAMNINAKLQKVPGSKVVVLTSRGNVKEISDKGFKSMASWFTTFTKINPLTIDLATLTEKCKDEQHPLYGSRKVKVPTVFEYKGTPFISKELNTITEQKGVFTDLQVYFPQSSYRNERPTWLEMHGYRKYQELNPDKHGMNKPCMVLAFKKGEDPTFAVPIDVIEVGNTSTTTSLLLPIGEYTLLLNDGSKIKQVELLVE